MIKIIFTLVAFLFSVYGSAQAPFTYYRPTPPPSTSSPSIPSLPNYNYRHTPRSYSSSIPNGFSGITLWVTWQQETIRKLQGLSFYCDSGTSGEFGQVVTRNGCEYEGADFQHITFYFFRNRLWRFSIFIHI